MTFWVSFFFFSLFSGGCLGLYTLHSSVYLESLIWRLFLMSYLYLSKKNKKKKDLVAFIHPFIMVLVNKNKND